MCNLIMVKTFTRVNWTSWESSSGMKSTFFQSCQTLRNEILKIVKTTLKAQVNIYQLSNWLKQDKKLLGLRLGDSRD